MTYTREHEPFSFIGSSIEIVRETDRSKHPTHIFFDFDGTISLIREGWKDVMITYAVEVIGQTGTDETPRSLHDLASDFITKLTGRQTIYQMIRLAGEVEKRGAVPRDPLEYKHEFNSRLLIRIEKRLDGLRAGTINPELLMVPYAVEMLTSLEERGTTLYLASGTDEQYVVEEAELLGIAHFFENRIYGACDDYQAFSKEKLIRQILHKNEITGGDLLGFGDGYVEIENMKSAGGTAVAVASDETGRNGGIDESKRSRLITAGADIVIPDYRDYKVLCDYLWNV